MLTPSFKEGRSIDTQDNPRSPSRRSESDDENRAEDIQRKNTRYSFSSEVGRKNVLILCLLVVCLVSNFNETRRGMGRRNMLFSDLDQILSQNKATLLEALDQSSGDLSLGVNDMNSEYLDLAQSEGPTSIVKMNGLVPFVAKRLPLDKSHEQSLFDLCLKYANVNIERNCQCAPEEKLETQQEEPTTLKSRVRRYSRYNSDDFDKVREKGGSLKNVILSKHVSNTKALEPYKGADILETKTPKEVKIEKKKTREVFQLNQESPQTSALDNFATSKISRSFKLPKTPPQSISPFFDFASKQPAPKSKRRTYQCTLKQTQSERPEPQSEQFELVLGKRCFDKLKPQGTYFSPDFVNF